MSTIAQLIADLVRAGTDPDLIGRVAATIANVRNVDEQAERRRAADRARKAACKAGIPQNSAESAESAELVSPLVPPLEGFPTPLPKTPPIIPPSIKTSRATELPNDWEPDAKTWALADELGFTTQETWDQLDRMRDWAKNAGGGKGRKSDWNAAFRNWIKRAADERRNKPQAPRRNNLQDSFAVLDAVVDEAIRRSDGSGQAGGEEDSFEFPGLRKSAA